MRVTRRCVLFHLRRSRRSRRARAGGENHAGGFDADSAAGITSPVEFESGTGNKRKSVARIAGSRLALWPVQHPGLGTEPTGVRIFFAVFSSTTGGRGREGGGL